MKFQIRSAQGGISDWADRGISGAFKMATGLDIRKFVDSLSAQQALTDIGVGVYVDLVRWQVPSIDGNTYQFGDAGNIYKVAPNDTVTLVYTEPGGGITGAAEIGIQLADLSIENHLFWADSAGGLHHKKIPGQTNWSDVDDTITGLSGPDQTYPKSNLDVVDWHTMRPITGQLFIANADKLAEVGRDGSYTTEALRLYPTDYAKTLIQRGNYAIIGAYSTSNLKLGTIYSWLPEEEQNFGLAKQLPVKGINVLLDTEIGLMQTGVNGGITYSNFSDFLPVFSFPGGGQVNPDGADVDDGIALFGVFGGVAGTNGVYTVGRDDKNRQFVVNLDYPLEVDEIGSVKNLGSEILVSYKDGDEYGVKKVDPDLKIDSARFESLELVGPNDFESPVMWEKIVLPTKDMPTGTKINVYYKVDKADSWTQAVMEGDIADFEEGTEATFLIGAQGNRIEIAVVLIPNGNETPEVYFPIDIYFT